MFNYGFLPFAAQAVRSSPSFTMIIFTLIFGDKSQQCRASATFKLNICWTIIRISGRSYCWCSYWRSSWCGVICCLYISRMLPKEDGGGKVAVGTIWGSIWGWYRCFVKKFSSPIFTCLNKTFLTYKKNPLPSCFVFFLTYTFFYEIVICGSSRKYL